MEREREKGKSCHAPVQLFHFLGHSLPSTISSLSDAATKRFARGARFVLLQSRICFQPGATPLQHWMKVSNPIGRVGRDHLAALFTRSRPTSYSSFAPPPSPARPKARPHVVLELLEPLECYPQSYPRAYQRRPAAHDRCPAMAPYLEPW